MNNEKAIRIRQLCQNIADDMEADAVAFDGKPFNGRTVAEYLANQGAAIAALARVALELLDAPPREPVEDK